MTDPPTYAEMMAVADHRADFERDAEERDGFLAEEWSEDGDTWGCLGHVDRAKFLAQVRRRYEADGYMTSQDATVDQVEHRYVLVDPDENAAYLYRWAVPVDIKSPPVKDYVWTRSVTADDPGAEPVTMLDL
jgi:hypothetical protein